jgi:hypothetical protein
LLDLLPQLLRRSLVTGLAPARASLTPRLAEASASQSLPSQLNRPGYAELCRLLDRRTEQGNNLRAYDDQLRSAVTSITATFQQKLAASLQSGRQFILPTLEEQVAADSEFELLTWLVILSPASPGT